MEGVKRFCISQSFAFLDFIVRALPTMDGVGNAPLYPEYGAPLMCSVAEAAGMPDTLKPDTHAILATQSSPCARNAYCGTMRKAAFAPQVATVKLPSGASARPTGLLSPSAITVRRP